MIRRQPRSTPLYSSAASDVYKRQYLERAPRDFITFEYVMLEGVNDSVQQAHELVKLVRDVPCKFNLIPFNPFPQTHYRRSRPEAIQRFRDVLTVSYTHLRAHE